MLVEYLIAQHTGFRLLTAPDAVTGIDLARTHRPDVILMDVNLPGINGFQALRMLRQDPALAEIPVVAISANAFPEDISRGLTAGFFRYITKPFNIVEFMQILKVAGQYSRTASKPQG